MRGAGRRRRVRAAAEDRIKMREWNQHRIAGLESTAGPLVDPKGVALGSGLARILQLCEPQKPGARSGDCRPPASAEKQPPSAPIDAEVAELMRLREREAAASVATPTSTRPTVELLAATVGGAPNVVAAHVERVDVHGAKELDDNFVVTASLSVSRSDV